jgi:hypothetical protein
MISSRLTSLSSLSLSLSLSLLSLASTHALVRRYLPNEELRGRVKQADRRGSQRGRIVGERFRSQRRRVNQLHHAAKVVGAQQTLDVFDDAVGAAAACGEGCGGGRVVVDKVSRHAQKELDERDGRGRVLETRDTESGETED